MRYYFMTVFGLLAAVFALNSFVDVSGLDSFGSVYALAARQAPDEILAWESSFDQRAWVKARILEGHSCPNTLVLGSSTVGALSQDVLLRRELLNGWLSGPTVEDFEAVTAILEAAHCIPKHILFGIDPPFLNAKVVDERWMTLAPEYERYHSSLGPLTSIREGVRRDWATFKERLTFVSTRESVKHLLNPTQRGSVGNSPTLIRYSSENGFCSAISYSGYFRAHDGHFISCPKYRMSSKEIEQVAADYVAKDIHNIRSWQEVDMGRVRAVDALVRRWKSWGTDVVLLAPPYHPLTYAKLEADPNVRANLRAMDLALTELAARNGVKYRATRDPASVGCRQDDYNDSHHFTRPCFERIIRSLAWDRR